MKLKKKIALFLTGFFFFSLAGCTIIQNTHDPVSSSTPTLALQDGLTGSEDTGSVEVGIGSQNNDTINNGPEDKKVIHIWTFTHEITMIIDKFIEVHPDFGYEIKITDYSNSDAIYDHDLAQALAMGGSEAPDIYCVEMSHVMRFTQGDAYSYASDYESLGIDTDTLISKVSVAQYFIDIGTNPDGELIGLGYQSTAGAFIYRRSIAKDVWGTDDPTVICDIIGPGWEKYFKAAAALKTKGYGICSGIKDIWIAVQGGANQGWVVDNSLVIDPKREAYLDYARDLVLNDYTNLTQQWLDDWFADMNDTGKRKIFGFFGPSWFLNYVVVHNCGGGVNWTRNIWGLGCLCFPHQLLLGRYNGSGK